MLGLGRESMSSKKSLSMLKSRGHAKNEHYYVHYYIHVIYYPDYIYN